jgi:hypothetical protein
MPQLPPPARKRQSRQLLHSTPTLRVADKRSSPSTGTAVTASVAKGSSACHRPCRPGPANSIAGSATAGR